MAVLVSDNIQSWRESRIEILARALFKRSLKMAAKPDCDCPTCVQFRKDLFRTMLYLIAAGILSALILTALFLR